MGNAMRNGWVTVANMDVEDLLDALDDRDPEVRQAAVAALDRMTALQLGTLPDLMERANDEEPPGFVGLARYLVHVGTPEAIEAALPIIAGDTSGEEREELLAMLAAAKGLTDERLKALLAEGPRQDDCMHRTAAEILGLRGFAEGYRELFRAYGGWSLYNQFIARGPEGIRILCRAFPLHDCASEEIAERLAARPRKTEATIHELIADPSSGGARTAIEVLGYWDEPRNVDLLIQIAEDPARDKTLREQAIASLCRLEAPEAMDVLVRTLLDREQPDWLRWDCACALGDIGKPDALEALESIAKSDPDPLLREFAGDAIEIIQNPAAA